MSLHSLIPYKFLSKAPHALALLVQTLFAVLMPEVYEKMPPHLAVSYLGLTPENLERLKFVIPAFIAVVGCYKQEITSHIVQRTAIPDQHFKCCMGH